MNKIFTLALLLCSFQLFASDKNFAAPTQAPKDFKVSITDGDRLSLSWTIGNGSRRLIIARKAAPVTFFPSNGVSYNASQTFGNGNEVNTGEFVVYNDASNSASVIGLQPNTQYHFAIFEYSGSGSSIEYNTTQTVTSGFTTAPPTVQPTNLHLTGIIGNSMTLNWTNPPAGSIGTGRIVIAREGAPVNVNPTDLASYTSNTIFGRGTEIGTGNYVITQTNGNVTTITGLKPATAYYFAVFEYKGSNGLVFNVTAPPTATATTLPRPTQNASGAFFQNVEGSSMRIYFSKGNGARRIVVAKAGSAVSGQPVDGATYTANSVFGTAGTELASGEYVVANGNVSDVSITNLAKSTAYHFAVFEYDGTGNFSRYLTDDELTVSQSTATAPTLQATGATATNVLNTTATLSWQPGNGLNKLVIMRKDAPVNVTPADLTSYPYSGNFGSGTQIGSGNYAMYASNANTVNVSLLTPGATYHFAVFEYNGSSKPVYLTSNPATGQFTTSQSPTNVPTGFSITSTEGNRLRYEWDNGNGTQRLAVIKAGSAVTAQPANGVTYVANAAFGSGNEIAPGEFVVMATNANQILVTNLLPGTTYHIAVFEYNLVNGQPYYLATPGRFSGTTVSAPTGNSASMTYANVIGNSMKLTWTKGTGAKRLVVAKMGAAVDVTPGNFTSYSASSSFGSGTHLGNGNYAVYADNSNTVTLSGLLPGTTYHFAVFEYNGSTQPVYLTNGALTSSHQTADRPTVPSKDMVFGTTEGNKMNVSWTKGNGVRRLVIGRAGSPVTALPEDGQDYNSSLAFGSGSEILPGQFVLAEGNVDDAAVTGLQPSTRYYFAVFEYDGTGSGTRYLTSSYLNGSKATLSAPANGPSNILYSSVGTTTATINWTAATADRHLVILRKTDPVSAAPQQLQTYNSNTSFGYSNSQIAPGEHVVFAAGNATSVNVTSMQPGTTYHVAVYAYNGSTGPMYNLAQVATSSFTTLGPPAEAAKEVGATSGGNGTSVIIRWKNGSGQRRLVLMRAGNAVTALPVDATSYTANSFFGSGHDFGAGNYAVYNGPADQVTVTNLQKNQVYHIAVFEYNQFTTGPVYLTTSFAQGQFSGAILPVKLNSFSGVATQTANVLSWTTAQEINVTEFIVERSVNGSSFTAIGTVRGTGNSTTGKHYQFEDRNRAAVNYYRLQMMDANGKVEHSNILRLQTAKEEGMKVFPTIATTSLQLSVTAGERSTAIARVVDMSGRVMSEQHIKLENGVVTTTIEVSHLKPGNYLLQLQTGNKQLAEKFIKQ